LITRGHKPLISAALNQSWIGAVVIDEIKHWDSKARSGFVYVPDPGTDTWRSHADDVLANRSWQGDCDDLVSTVLDLLGRAGVPLDHRYRLEVASRHSGQINHLVGAVVADDGGFWIVGDTFGAAYPAADMRHTAYEYSRLSEGKIVRQGAPWVTA